MNPGTIAEPEYSGYLSIKVCSLFKKKTLTNCWCALYNGKGTFPPRLDIHEDRAKADPSMCKKSIDIIGAKWSKPETMEPAFCFTIKSKRYIFISKSREECTVWFQYLCCMSPDLFDSHQEMISSGQAGIPGSDNDIVMQENVLYTSSNEVSTFDVVADKSGSCKKFGFRGLLKLKIDDQSIKLCQPNSSNPLTEWTYFNIRAFGHSTHTVYISSGSKSFTGEGKFSFITVEGGKMVELVEFYTKSLKAKESRLPNTTSESQEKANSYSNMPPYSTSLPGKKPAPFPKPTSLPQTPSPGLMSHNVIDAQFKRELSHTVRSNTSQGEVKQSLDVTLSTNSHRSSIESLGKKEGKKVQKEKEKLAKKQEKDDKKREKQERENQKQLEKAQKNEKKAKDKPVPPKKDFIPDNDIEGIYSVPEECGYETRSVPSPSECKVESKVYSEPWGSLSQFIPAQEPIEDVDEEDVNIYASPNKPGIGIKKLMANNEEMNYEEIEPNSNVPPPIILPKAETRIDDDSNNVYDHFAEVSSDSQGQPENVYGMESAQPLTNNVQYKRHENSNPSDTYETVG